MGPARFHCATLLLPVLSGVVQEPWWLAASGRLEAGQKVMQYARSEREVGDSSETRHLTEREERWDEDKSRVLSEVGFEPTPSEEDHDLNVAP